MHPQTSIIVPLLFGRCWSSIVKRHYIWDGMFMHYHFLESCSGKNRQWSTSVTSRSLTRFPLRILLCGLQKWTREPALVPILSGRMIGRCGTPAFTAFWRCGGFLFYSLLEQLVHHTSHFGFPPRRKSKMVWAFGAHPGVYPAILTAQILQQPRVI